MSEPKLNSESADPTKPQLLVFLKELMQADLTEDCRRSFRRHSSRQALSVQPLTDDFLPDGKPISGYSSDISLKGMAFVNPKPIEHEFVRISFSRFDYPVIAMVKHSSPVGIDCSLYLVGVEFLDEYYDQ